MASTFPDAQVVHLLAGGAAAATTLHALLHQAGQQARARLVVLNLFCST